MLTRLKQSPARFTHSWSSANYLTWWTAKWLDFLLSVTCAFNARHAHRSGSCSTVRRLQRIHRWFRLEPWISWKTGSMLNDFYVSSQVAQPLSADLSVTLSPAAPSVTLSPARHWRAITDRIEVTKVNIAPIVSLLHFTLIALIAKKVFQQCDKSRKACDKVGVIRASLISIGSKIIKTVLRARKKLISAKIGQCGL